MMRRSGGFSIVEMVVVTIVVIGLMALGVNLYLGHQARGLDQVAETSLQRVAGGRSNEVRCGRRLLG